MLVIFVRTLILYLLVVLFIRLMGKRQIGELQPFEFVITMLMADMVASPMQDAGLPLIQGIIPLLAMFIIHNVITYLSLKSNVCRILFSGRPSVLVEKGKVNQKELEKINISLNDLMENLRVKEAPNLEDILYATLETNGEVSVLLKSKVQTVTREDLNIQAPETGRVMLVVADGKLDKKNLGYSVATEEKLTRALHKVGFASVKEVFLATVDETGRLYAQGYGENPKTVVGQVS